MARRNTFLLDFVMPALGLLAVVGFKACISAKDETGMKALTEAGYGDVQMGGWAPTACWPDGYARRFQGTQNDRTVSGVICCGTFMKACTVRF